MTRFLLAGLTLLPTLPGTASQFIAMTCEVRVPPEYQQDPPSWVSPTGESEAQRYTRGYEAYWWNGVTVKAGALHARCPITCSGSPAAAAGCADGANDAADSVWQQLRAHSEEDIIDYLATLASDPAADERMAPYFPEGPRAETPVE